MFRFSVDTAELQARLERGLQNAEDFSDPFEDLADEAREEFARNFREEGTMAPWAPLSQATIRRKAAAGQPARALVATGELERSFIDQGAKGNISEAGPGLARFGSNHPLANAHQSGQDGRPVRDLLQVTDGFLDEVEEVAGDHVQGGFE